MVIKWRVSQTFFNCTVSCKVVMMIMINLYQDGNFYDDLPHTRIFMMTYLSQDGNAE